MWAAVAADLARDFTVVAPDLRGYGESSQPPTVPDHETYGKRAMAADGDHADGPAGLRPVRRRRARPRGAGGLPDGAGLPGRRPPAHRGGRGPDRGGVGPGRRAVRPGLLALGLPGPARTDAGDDHRARPGALLPRRAVRRRSSAASTPRRWPTTPARCTTRRSCTPSARTTGPAPTCDRQRDDGGPGGGAPDHRPLQVLWGARGALPAWYDTAGGVAERGARTSPARRSTAATSWWRSSPRRRWRRCAAFHTAGR